MTSEREGVRGLDAVREVLAEMRERKINHGRDTSPTLVAWADRIERAITTPPADAEQRARELLADAYAAAGFRESASDMRKGRINYGALERASLSAIASALSQQPEARGVVDALPFQRWSMTKGSDGKRWSVCMDHDPCGEWVKWIDVQQHFFVAAITEARNG